MTFDFDVEKFIQERYADASDDARRRARRLSKFFSDYVANQCAGNPNLSVEQLRDVLLLGNGSASEQTLWKRSAMLGGVLDYLGLYDARRLLGDARRLAAENCDEIAHRYFKSWHDMDYALVRAGHDPECRSTNITDTRALFALMWCGVTQKECVGIRKDGIVLSDKLSSIYVPDRGCEVVMPSLMAGVCWMYADAKQRRKLEGVAFVTYDESCPYLFRNAKGQLSESALSNMWDRGRVLLEKLTGVKPTSQDLKVNYLFECMHEAELRDGYQSAVGYLYTHAKGIDPQSVLQKYEKWKEIYY